MVTELRTKHKADVGAKYKEDHMVLFERYGMPWPASLEPVQTIDEYTLVFAGMTVRQVEMTILLHTQFPSECDVEFLDVNPSLNQLTGFKQGDDGLPTSSPWKLVPETLVGSSFIIVRCLEYGFVRPLVGFEYMQLIGWDASEWVTCRPFSTTSPMPSHALCSELAGNAFSAFVMCPLVAALMACSGAVRQLREEADVAKASKRMLRSLAPHPSCSSVGGSSMDGD